MYIEKESGRGSVRVGSDFLSAIAGRVGSGQRFAGSGVATIFGSPANNFFGPLAKGLRRLLLPDGPLQPRPPAFAGPAEPSLRPCSPGRVGSGPRKVTRG